MHISVFKNNREYLKIDLLKIITENNGADINFFIGRSSDCHIVLDDMKVSRQHAELKYLGKEWILNSDNQLFVNGSPTCEAKLKNGDQVSIEPFFLVFDMEDVDGPAVDVASTEQADETEEMEQVEEAKEAEDANEEISAEVGEETASDGEEFANMEHEEEGGEQEVLEDENFDGIDDFPVEEVPEDGDGEKTSVLNTFAKFELEIFGEYAPYDKYVIESDEVIIGRDPEKCKIVLDDSEVSGTHAVIKKNNIVCVLEDLKSSNGTILNGQRINSHVLKNGDEFVIGSTTFTIKVQSDFIKEEAGRLMPVEQNQSIEVEEVVEVDTNFDEDTMSNIDQDSKGGNKSLFSKEALKDPEKRKKILMIVAALVVLWVLMGEDETSKKGAKKNTQAKTEKSKDKESDANKTKKVAAKVGKNEVKLTQEQREFIDSTYILAKDLFESGKYRAAMIEIDRIHQIASTGYKRSKFMEQLTKEALEEQERLATEAIKRKEETIKKAKVKKLIKDAKDAFDKKDIELSKNIIGRIIELDPENKDASYLKLKIDLYQKKKEKEALLAAEKKANRKRQEKSLMPGKTLYLKKDWYKAILELEKFLKQDDIDEDLVKSGTTMLTESKKKLDAIVSPLASKARSLKEGQDLKGAYQQYLEIIDHVPSHKEALNGMDSIREELDLRSKKVYREAIVSESLSLFDEAKEKFQEVQQISTTDSEYYKKASEKLKKYLD